MSSAAFYEAACRTGKSADMRALMADLLERASQQERLLGIFGKQVLANRTRREGKPPKISKAGKEWLREAEEESRKQTADEFARLVAKLSDEQLLRQALDGWHFAIQVHNPADYHEDDQALAKQIDRNNRQAMRLVKAFYRSHGMPIPLLGSRGGISFNAAFKRPIDGLGTLGGDCTAIYPVLAALDKIAEKAKLPTLSQFVNHDAQGLTAEKAEWFDPALGLTTVRGLLAELGRSARGVKNATQVVQDLRTLEDDLVQTEENKVRFHFVMLD